jgi:hypothetical protein
MYKLDQQEKPPPRDYRKEVTERHHQDVGGGHRALAEAVGSRPSRIDAIQPDNR